MITEFTENETETTHGTELKLYRWSHCKPGEMTKYSAQNWMTLRQRARSPEIDGSHRCENYQFMLLKLHWIMSVGMLQSQCFDCVSPAHSKSHLIIWTAGRARGVFLDEPLSDLEKALGDTAFNSPIAPDSRGRACSFQFYHSSKKKEWTEWDKKDTREDTKSLYVSRRLWRSVISFFFFFTCSDGVMQFSMKNKCMEINSNTENSSKAKGQMYVNVFSHTGV